MNSSPLNIVWLKRDLRTRDHAALAAAEARHIRYLIIYLVEPDWLQRSDFGLRHWQFVGGSIADINRRLKPFGLDVKVFFGDPIEVFS